MKKYLFIICLLPALIFAQYWGERTTEQSFEESEVYFTSYYLNTFGLFKFKNLAPGLIDDPYLNLYLNPAISPLNSENEFMLYLDFRGDHKVIPIRDQGYFPMYYDYYRPYYRPDPRWLSVSRSEPEPVFSLGVITNPVSDITPDFYLAATYQLIHKDEPFYEMPYWIYNSRYGYDSFGGAYTEAAGNVPIEDRYSGTDEMNVESHLFSTFAGYSINPRLTVGLGLNAVLHERLGEYGNSYNDEYGNTDNYEWESSNGIKRNQDYHHVDVSLGVNYKLSESVTAGIKAGQLNGEAKQGNESASSYFSQQNTPNVSDTWYYSFSNSSQVQRWKHNGFTRYIGFNFSRLLKDNKQISAYYRYSWSDVDVKTSSDIIEVSDYSSRYYYSWDSTYHNSRSRYTTTDHRTGTGFRKKFINEALLNFSWQITANSRINMGFYLWHNTSNVFSNEPVYALRSSDYQSNYYSRFYTLLEDKRLEWRYKSVNWQIQIPVILNFRLHESWMMMFGISRQLTGWKIEDQTIAYFDIRERDENGEIKTETNFGERYTQPTKKISEDDMNFIMGFDAKVSNAFNVKFLLDPDLENQFRIAQWWIGFETRL